MEWDLTPVNQEVAAGGLVVSGRGQQSVIEQPPAEFSQDKKNRTTTGLLPNLVCSTHTHTRPHIALSGAYLTLCKTDQLHTKTVCGF